MTAYVWQRWLVTEFRAAGLTVIPVEGWENRGRPASSGGYDPREALLIHHTGTHTSAARPNPTLRTLIVGRPDLPGPLAPYSVDFFGRVFVIAAGRCNHAGAIGKPVPFARIGADGNALMMGNEVDTDGTQPMSPAQRRAIAITSRVVIDHIKRDVDRIYRHADTSGTGKWDLGSLTTGTLRSDADAATTHQEDLTIVDADTKKYLDDQFRRTRDVAAATRKVARATAASVDLLTEQLAGTDKKLTAKVSASRKAIEKAIAELDAADAPLTAVRAVTDTQAAAARARRRGAHNSARNRAAAWRRARAGRVVWSVMASNLPEHDPATPGQQAAWVDDQLELCDVVTIAECSGRLAAAVGAYPRVKVTAATPNFGGNGNAVATSHKLPRRRRSEYQCTFRSVTGRSFALHMARAEVRKQGTRCTFDAVHLPPKGEFKTSSTPAERANVIRQIAHRRPRTAAWVVSGDWNTDVATVLAELRKVDRRWIHLGGAGVEQVFGIGVKPLGDNLVTYGRVTDHEHTAKVKFGLAA